MSFPHRRRLRTVQTFTEDVTRSPIRNSGLCRSTELVVISRGLVAGQGRAESSSELRTAFTLAALRTVVTYRSDAMDTQGPCTAAQPRVHGGWRLGKDRHSQVLKLDLSEPFYISTRDEQDELTMWIPVTQVRDLLDLLPHYRGVLSQREDRKANPLRPPSLRTKAVRPVQSVAERRGRSK